MVFGGYNSTLMHRIDDRSMLKFSYLADSFVYEANNKTWKYVYVEEWPPYRAGSTLVYVPPASAEGADDTLNQGERGGRKEHTSGGGGGGGSSERVPKKRHGRVLLLGGYCYDIATSVPMPMNDVWELTLLSGPKHVRVPCWGCGKVDTGRRQCAGSCGGAVVTCSVVCQDKVWKGGHKHWCRKV